MGAPAITAPPGAGVDWWKDQTYLAVTMRDQKRTDALLVSATLQRVASESEIELWFRDAVATSSHDTQMWWMGSCNCDGHLN